MKAIDYESIDCFSYNICLIGNRILLGSTKKESFGSYYSSCNDCAIYYNKFFRENNRIRYHRSYLYSSYYYRVVHRIF